MRFPEDIVIVTGAGGFIGANLVRRLLSKHFTVHVIVRSGSNLWRLSDVLQSIHIHEGVLLSYKKLRKLLVKIKPAHIFHLATYGSYPKQIEMPQVVETNIQGVLVLMKVLEEIHYKSFIVAGSSSEYGKKTVSMAETDVLEPNNFYGAAKAAQSLFVQAWAKSQKRHATILRLFNVYGFYEEEGRLVRSVIESAISNNPIKLASGKEARDFIFAEDVADAFLAASKKSFYYGDVFNIGTGKQTTIYELAKKVISLTHSKSAILRNAYPGRPWDSLNWKADMSNTYKNLNWKAKIQLVKGLEKTIFWYQTQINS